MTSRAQKDNFSFFLFILKVNDLAVVFLSGFFAYQIYLVPQYDNSLWEHYLVAITLGSTVAIIVFHYLNLYSKKQDILLEKQIRQIIIAWIVLFVSLAVLSVITKTSIQYSRVWFLSWFVIGVLSTLFLRLIFHFFIIKNRKKSTVILIGEGELLFNVITQIKKNSYLDLNILGYFSDAKNRDEYKVEYLGVPDKIKDFCFDHSVDQVWIIMPLSAEQKIKNILYLLRHETCDIRYIPDFFGFNMINHSFSEVAGMPVINLSASPLNESNRILKLIEDKVLASIILILILPVMLLISLLVKISSKGPVFYIQERVSWNNKVFKMLKFRSMHLDAEKISGPVWAKKDEIRTTQIGKFLRKTSLDELPQFFNVLKGDMSIVGPRPERPFFVNKFKDDIPYYMKKHMVKAGITGWAQINGLRGNGDLHKRIEYDLYYIENWSIWFDLKIIVMTLFKGFLNKNAY